MAWSWSHTQDAYDYVAEQCDKLPQFTAREIMREIMVYRGVSRNGEPVDWEGWDDRLYQKSGPKVFRMTLDACREEIKDFAFDHRTCDNGGWNAWLCPFGCGCHTVPFGPEDD